MVIALDSKIPHFLVLFRIMIQVNAKQIDSGNVFVCFWFLDLASDNFASLALATSADRYPIEGRSFLGRSLPIYYQFRY